MRLLVIRHAHAAPQTPGGRDADRPLTDDGVRRFRAAARGLVRAGLHAVIVLALGVALLSLLP